MRSLHLAAALALAGTAMGQSPAAAPTVPKPTISITDAEKIRILHSRADALAALDALKSSPQYAQYVAASTDAQAAIVESFKHHSVTEAEYTLCDGPTQPGCQQVAKGELVLVPKAAPPTTPQPATPTTPAKPSSGDTPAPVFPSGAKNGGM